MNITINIPALSELAKSIDNLAIAWVTGRANPSVLNPPSTTTTTTARVGDTELTESTTVTGDGAGETLPEITNGERTGATEPTLTPTEKQKNAINEEIVALGGTPLESGSLVKHQDVLTALQEAAKTPVEDVAEGKRDDTSEECPEGTNSRVNTVDEVEGTPANTLENARMLAGYVVKKEDNDGLAKLGACLKEVGAKNITVLFDSMPDSVDEFIASLLAHAGNKSFAEIVAEAKAQANG